MLITGGVYSDTEELYVASSNITCSLPRLPDRRYEHTLESTGLMCAGMTTHKCLKWSPDTGSWEKLLRLDTGRYGHVSWTPDNGIGTYLLGNRFSDRTTTLVKPDGTQEPGFPLQYDAM